MNSYNHLIAVAQMKSSNRKGENMKSVEKLVEKAASRGAQMVFLPEGCDYIGESSQETIEFAEFESGETLSKYCQLARSLRIWLSVGGIHIKEENENKISNSHFLIDNMGSIVARYNKTHLFDVVIPEQNLRLQESTYVERGKNIPNPVLTPCGLVSMEICYDLRFPELSLLQRKAGAQILTFPSSFTVPTGLAHWHTLLRARAIETQCYVVAAAQTGHHNSKRSSFGHALVVDPWGVVIAEVSEGTNVAFAEIDLKYLEKVRREMPVLNHRRNDLYALYSLSNSCEPGLIELIQFPADYVTYPFGQVSIRGSYIFLRTQVSHAFVNKKPFFPGHVLVAPQRPAERFGNLLSSEVGDFGQAIVLTLQVLVDKYKCCRCQIAIQDGKYAGQTINHLHAHVMPIPEGAVFVENHESKDIRCWRSEEVMTKEAAQLRSHTNNVQSNNWLSSSDIPRSLRFEDPRGRGQFLCKEEEILAENVFAYTGSCFAFIPRNQILPGHVCVCPCVEASCLSDLSPGCVSDIFLALQSLQQVLEERFRTTSSTIYIESCSSEKGICAHIIPRKDKDLLNGDEIYSLLYSFKPEGAGDTQDELLLYLKTVFNGQHEDDLKEKK